jgi:hypothetical protein
MAHASIAGHARCLGHRCPLVVEYAKLKLGLAVRRGQVFVARVGLLVAVGVEIEQIETRVVRKAHDAQVGGWAKRHAITEVPSVAGGAMLSRQRDFLEDSWVHENSVAQGELPVALDNAWSGSG